MSNAIAEQKKNNPVTVFRDQFHEHRGEIERVLPEHISIERFERVVFTAVNQNPDLAQAHGRSLFTACVQSAQDGLLPDGREAALVLFNSKVNGQWVKMVQYMPMIAGIYKKVRNSGQLASLSAQVVYENDDFDYQLGDEPLINHKPNLFNRGNPIAAYAIAKLKDGTVEREVMSVGEIEQVREVSRAAEKEHAPWVKWWSEMARKTVVRRLSKRLPMSSDLEALIRRDDDLYDLEAPRKPALPRPQRSAYMQIAAEKQADADAARMDEEFKGAIETDSATSSPESEEDAEQGRDLGVGADADGVTPAPETEGADTSGELPPLTDEQQKVWDRFMDRLERSTSAENLSKWSTDPRVRNSAEELPEEWQAAYTLKLLDTLKRLGA